MKKKKQHPYCKARIVWRINNAMDVKDLRDLLTMVDIDCPVAALNLRTNLERAQAEEWACQVHLSASDNKFIRIPPKPEWLAAFESLPARELTGEWADLKEMKRSDFLGPER